MRTFLSRIHARLGDLWWYTILLFVAQRFGDVINMFVGLWLVPKYVPQEELGAVMPLTQFASFVGIPMTIVAIPFMKYLTVFAGKGEFGRVKSLLRDVFIGTGATVVLTVLIAWCTIPFFFERIRVATGSLGLLVVAVSLVGAVSSIFQNAVQGLKLYSSTVWMNLLVAPVRLGVMLVAMPFRALSGYFVGQGSSQSVPVVAAFWALRKWLGRQVKAEPYWHEYGAEMLRYASPVALGTVVSIMCVSVETLVIRHRLSAFESAGYYMISMFASVAAYLGSSFVVFLFPMVSEAKAKDVSSLHVLRHSLYGTLGAGSLVALLLLLGGNWLLGLMPHWKVYRPLSFEMFLLAVSNVLTAAVTCLSTYEAAQGRFRNLWYCIPILLVRFGLLYVLTGFSFFDGMLPDSWLVFVNDLHLNRLSFIMWYDVAFTALTLACFATDVFMGASRKNNIVTLCT